MLNLPTDNAVAVLGDIDSLKLRSSMTLFDAVLPNDIFVRVIDKLFAGDKDRQTMTILHKE